MAAVDVASFALLVRAEFSTLAHTFVDAYAEPGQSFVDIVFGSGNEAVGVGVLDTENHVAAVLSCKKVIIQRGPDAADM